MSTPARCGSLRRSVWSNPLIDPMFERWPPLRSSSRSLEMCIRDSNTAPDFAVLVYAQDFNHSGSIYSTSTGFYGGTLDHPMNYLFARWSDSTTYSMFSANSSGGWTWDSNLSTQAPQWDTATGRIELEIPITNITSSGSAAAGSWSYMDVETAYDNSGTWTDDDITDVYKRQIGTARRRRITPRGSPQARQFPPRTLASTRRTYATSS